MVKVFDEVKCSLEYLVFIATMFRYNDKHKYMKIDFQIIRMQGKVFIKSVKKSKSRLY